MKALARRKRKRAAIQLRDPMITITQTDPRALTVLGPLIDIAWRVPVGREAELVAAGKAVPEPVRGQALVDTGASLSLISRDAATRLGLAECGWTNVLTLGEASRAVLFEARLDLIDDGGNPLASIGLLVPAHDEPVPIVGTVGIVGRDLLRHVRFTYDGPANQITVTWTPPGAAKRDGR